MQEGDLKIGMRLINNGPGDIPIYFSLDGTGDPILTIKPGQDIGQIVAFSYSNVLFVSDEITAALPLGYKIGTFLVQWLTSTVDAAAVRFSDIQANVTDAQIQAQQSALNGAQKGNEGLKNDVELVGGELKKLLDEGAEGIKDSAEKAIPWTLILIGAGAWLLFTNRNLVAKKSQKLLN